MAQKYYQAITITGAANDEKYDTGITSTEKEKRTVTAILLNVTKHVGNLINVRVEREKIAEIYDYIVDTSESTGGANTQKAVAKIARIELGHALDTDRTMKVSIKCGATAANVFGAYEYEISPTA